MKYLQCLLMHNKFPFKIQKDFKKSLKICDIANISERSRWEEWIESFFCGGEVNYLMERGNDEYLLSGMWSTGVPWEKSKRKKNCGKVWWEFLFFKFFSFIFISWRLITLQYCSGFCRTLTWISHALTCVPHPIPLGLPSAPARSTCLVHPTWAGDLFHPWLYICFYAILSEHSTLTFSHRVPKSVLYICVYFSVLHIGLYIWWGFLKWINHHDIFF